MSNNGRMTLRGGPPPDSRGPISLAEYVHVERKRVLLMFAHHYRGYKHLVAKTLRLSRPQLDRYIRLYGIRESFRGQKPRRSRAVSPE